MKLKFNPNLQYQLDALDSVVNVFDGQPLEESTLEFEADVDSDGFDLTDFCVSNQLLLSDDDLADNIAEIQKENDIEPDVSVGDGFDFPQFTIEMETGTGKTYVYLRSIYELHQKYGFSKFIIVVPSVAIREGVLKSLEITSSHFAELYDKPPVDYFVYDSDKLGKLRSFATSNNLQVMVTNIDSFNKDRNIINRYNDQLSGAKPLEFVQKTNPIVIMDEPQNMESEKSKEAIAGLNPMCTFRYSATHRTYPNLLHQLNPVDAYDLGLVKKIEVDSVIDEDNFNNAYIEVKSIDQKKTKISAKVKIHVNTDSGAKVKKLTISNGDDLYEKSNEREIYSNGFVVEGLDAGYGYIEFANGLTVEEGEAHGGLRDEVIKVQLEETIREHFEKMKRMKDRGIKVLSLVFIDHVKNYRKYSDSGAVDGKYAEWFEQAYKRLKQKDRYSDLNLPDAEMVHDGYFAKDRKGQWKDSHTGESKADRDTYELIMQDKERLLSQDEPLQFIFSHSALREGWDNPNVFQICTLNETKSEIKKRQEIGRGLRLPVNQDGERIRDENINILTVIANQSYEDYAQELQREIESETSVSFEGRVKNHRERRTVETNKGFKANEDFLALWDKIKHKTRYKVSYDTDELIEKASEKFANMPRIKSPTISVKKTSLDIDEEGVEAGYATRDKEIKADMGDISIPNILAHIEDKTELTRKTIYNIIDKSDRLEDILKNPQKFVDYAVESIRITLQDLMVDGIKYEKIDGDYYEMTRFESEEIESYLDNMMEVEDEDKTVYDHIIYDSDIEHDFARSLEAREDVAFYFKLPQWFNLDTPMGTYNPDWAIVFTDEKTRLYFMAETKGTNRLHELSRSEKLKIKCGKEHFKKLDDVNFEGPVKEVGDVKKQ